MKLKSILIPLVAIAIIFSSVFAMGQNKMGDGKNKIEIIAKQSTGVQLEHKESYKIDDAEYKGAVATNDSISESVGFIAAGIASMIGVVLLLSRLFRFEFLRNLFSTKTQIGIRVGVLAFAIVTMNAAAAALALLLPIFEPMSKNLGIKIKLNKEGASGDNLKLLEDLEKRFNELPDSVAKDAIDLQIREALKPYEGLDISKIKEMLSEDDKGLRSILLKQGEEITKLKGQLDNKQEDLSLRSQVEAWQKRNAEAVKKIKSGQKSELEPFQIRAAASPMTPANTISDTVAFSAGSVMRMGAEVFDIRRTQPTFWDFLPKGRTNLENLPWVNKKVPAGSGAAAFIGPGIAKPGVSFTFEVENSNAKKIAVSMKLATELLDDIDGMTTYIQVELAYQLKIKANTEMMTGVLSSTNPAGVQTFSLGFTTSGLSTINPNNWDCCRAVVAQIRKAFIDGQIVIFMNPIDTANMDMEKAISQGTYMGLTIRQVPGAIIVEDYNVSAGFIQAVVVDCLKTMIYKDFVLKFGWENDDFTKNLVTAIAEMRFHSYHSENDAAAFVYDDLADIKSQIAAA